MTPRSTIPLALVAAAACGGPLARAASVQKVNKDRDKILLLLSQAEMAALEPGQEVIVEVEKPRFAVDGRVERINPVKKTAVIAFDNAEERFQQKQQVRFLSAFQNAETSSLVTSYAQYHQYSRSGVEGGAGAFYEGTSERAGGHKGFTQGWGSRVVGQGYILLSPTWFGAGVGFERRDIQYDDRAVTDQATQVTYNAVRPGFWAELQPHVRLGLKYDYTLIDEKVKTGEEPSFNYTFGQTEASLTYFDNDGEYGVDYLSKDANTSTFTESFATGVVKQIQSTRKMPAELYLYMRRIESPVMIWGAGVGYIFWERNLTASQPLRPKAYPEQMLRLRGSLETRMDDGDKLDFVASYDGAKALGYSTYEQRANMLGFATTYQTTAADGLLVGGTLQLNAGGALESDNVTDPTTGQTQAVNRDIYGYRVAFLAFARYEFDLLHKGRRR